MTKTELGTKRTCPNCGTRYYDLGRSPIVCPKCGTQFEVVATTARARPQPAAPKPVKPQPVEEVEEASADTVSLEEADDEAAGGAKTPAGEEDGDDEADDTFLTEEEEEDSDVGDIIGDVDEEEPDR